MFNKDGEIRKSLFLAVYDIFLFLQILHSIKVASLSHAPRLCPMDPKFRDKFFPHRKQDLKLYCSYCITDLRTMSAFQVDDTIRPKFKVKPICPVGSRTRRRCRSEKSVCFFEFIDEEFIIFGSSEDKINETCN